MTAIHCQSEFHIGERLIYRVDAVEERLEWRNLAHTRSLGSEVRRVICRDCFTEEKRLAAAGRKQSAMFGTDGTMFVDERR